MKNTAYVLAFTIAIALAAGPLGAGSGLSASLITPAMAGSYASSGYAGYEWSGTYPPWAAEAFQPSN